MTKSYEKGLPVNVYRNGRYDCTNGGVSSRADRVLLVGETVEGWLNVEGSDYPVVELVRGHLPGTVRIIPYGIAERPMFGGNYAGCSDDRFNRAVEALLGHRFYGAVAIHDRVEG